ncbi:unnamed protein product [Schistosoma turkestanicum]|nr:unnamed protein product [Schistosoma turkestanicum]
MNQHNSKPVHSSSSNIINTVQPTSSCSLPRTVYAHRLQTYSPVTFTHKKEYCNNEVVTSIYTLWNFLPKIIYEQLHYMSNIFFILVAILHMFADGATSVFAIIGPFSFVFLVTLLKDGIFDILRHYQDKQINERKFPVMQINLETNEIYWKLTKSKFIHVGDVILCKSNEEFPCDLILLATSSKDCSCRITTANLDGESTIKTHYSIFNTQNIYEHYFNDSVTYKFNEQTDQLLKSLFIKIDCQQPNEDFTNFQGCITTTSMINDQIIQPLTLQNILYKGAKLKSTKYIIGLVVYTGKDTKLILNSKKVIRKYSSRESKANEILLIFMIIMIGFCIIFSILTRTWSMMNLTNPFIPTQNFKNWTQVKGVFRFLFILNYLIPISLIITIEIQQITAAYFVSADINLYDSEQDIATKSNTPQLVDELGQVNYLFSDKTGTLTQNEMSLHTIAILNTNKIYVFNDRKFQNTTHAIDDHYNQTNKHIQLKQISQKTNKFGHIGMIYEKLNGLQQQHEYYEDNLGFISSSDSEVDEEDDNELTQQTVFNDIFQSKKNVTISSSNEYSSQVVHTKEMPNELLTCLTILALCHTVEVNEEDAEKQIIIGENVCMDNFYQATSPDEKALVIGAAKLGVIFMGTSVNENSSASRTYRIEYDQCLRNGSDQPEIMEYSIDAILEFDSFRKRMSIMAKHPDGTYHIHSKGAESSIFKISNFSNENAHHLASNYVTQFAIDGLRTLVYATRQVDFEEYHQLLNEFYQAKSLVGSQRNDALKEIYSKIEYNLQVVSITGVEDKLQPGVHECLKNLREAGIQVWVLTGDKEETAITVSRSAGHFTPNMSLVHLTDCEDYLSFTYKLFHYLEDLKIRRKKRNFKRKMKIFFEKPINALKMKTYSKNKPKVDFAYQTNSSDENYTFDNLKKLFTSKRPLQIEIDPPRFRHSKRPGSDGEPMALVIDGKSLRFALDPALRRKFLDLCLHLTTVLCCRMTPLQKASIVQLVRSGLSDFGIPPITAAIGDGGNDVAMLLQANIGIGIYGKEGKEAVRASDYAIPQFRHLQRLLLVHGHRTNHRLCLTMNLFYHKCVAFVTTQVLYTFYSGL